MGKTHGSCLPRATGFQANRNFIFIVIGEMRNLKRIFEMKQDLQKKRRCWGYWMRLLTVCNRGSKSTLLQVEYSLKDRIAIRGVLITIL
jgi:hypothetical protein